jgi:hypothetical protein
MFNGCSKNSKPVGSFVNLDSANRREYTREDTKALAELIKQRVTIKDLWERFFPGSTPGKSCKSPFRDDRNPSFSLYDNGKRWKDFGTGEGGESKSCDQRIPSQPRSFHHA